MRWFIAIVFVWFMPLVSWANDGVPVDQLATECNICHAVNSGNLKSLNGMDPAVFIAQVKAYQNGQIPNAPLMTDAVQDLDDATLKALAAYYANQ